MSSNTRLQLEENGNAEDKYGMTPVCRAIKSGNTDLVLAYINQGVDMNYRNSVDGVTPFIRACNTENLDMVKFLLDHVDNLNVNLNDYRGYSALDYSCQYGYNDIIRLILQRTKPKITLEMIEKALEKIKESVLKELIDAYKSQYHGDLSDLSSILAKGSASLDIILYARGGENAKHSISDDVFLGVCQSGNLKNISWLLNECDFKSKVNTCVDSDGRTGLMLAVLNHKESAVQLLLENGANPYIRDNSNWNAIDCAKNSYDDGADYLRLRDPPEEVNRIIKLLTQQN